MEKTERFLAGRLLAAITASRPVKLAQSPRATAASTVVPPTINSCTAETAVEQAESQRIVTTYD